MSFNTKIRLASLRFFQDLMKEDLHDHPQVFKILDDVARDHGYMISAKQKGIFGTILHFVQREN